MSEMLARDYYTKRDLADRFGISLSTVDNWVRAGLIGSYKLGGLVRFHPDEVDAFIERSYRRSTGGDAA